MNSQYLTIRGVLYHLRTKGSGPPVLLLHGFTGSTNTWEPILPYLSDEYTWIAIDLLGHGKTESPLSSDRYHMEDQVEDINEIRKTLGYKYIHLLGYSMGGRVALSYAVTYQEMVISLILESSSPGLQSAEERENRMKSDKSLANRIKKEGVHSFIDYWEQIPLFQSQQKLPGDVKQRIREERLSQSETGLANSLLGMGTGSQPSWWERLHELTRPILLITGEEDEKFIKIADRMMSGFPDARHLTVEEAGHTIHVEQAEKFGKIVMEFLKHNKEAI